MRHRVPTCVASLAARRHTQALPNLISIGPGLGVTIVMLQHVFLPSVPLVDPGAKVPAPEHDVEPPVLGTRARTIMWPGAGVMDTHGMLQCAGVAEAPHVV